MRQKKGTKRLDEADRDRLTDVLASSVAILYERAKNAVVYVFEPAARDDQLGKLFVLVDVRRKVRRRAVAGNYLRSAGYVQPGNLAEPRYELLWGELPPRRDATLDAVRRPPRGGRPSTGRSGYPACPAARESLT